MFKKFTLILISLFLITSILMSEIISDKSVEYANGIIITEGTIQYIAQQLTTNNPLGQSYTQRWQGMKIDSTNPNSIIISYVQGIKESGYNNYILYHSTYTHRNGTHKYDQNDDF
jgi:hypothetical protein